MANQRYSLTLVAALSALALTVFLTANHATAQTETVLHSFAGTDGASVSLGVIFDSAGNLYGVAAHGGSSNNGTVFELTPKSRGAWTEKTLISFNGGTGGSNPVGGVIFDDAGNLYGTTKLGGTNGVGVVYELSPSGSTWTEKVLHNFSGSKDGQYPTASLIFDAKGNLYGTTEAGGSFGDGTEIKGGTVFELSPKSAGGWTETVLHNFGSGTDGSIARSNLIFDKTGNLYGTTMQGGTNTWGTAFELSPKSAGGWTEKILHNFNPGNFSDGAQPVGGLIFDEAGNLYGVTTSGGSESGGVAFELTPKSGGSWIESVIYTFQYDGFNPSAPFCSLIFDTAGNLYGATFRGFGSGVHAAFDGTVFELTKTSGSWNQTTLYAFDGTHGSVPAIGSLVFDSSGNLYGATQSGGTSNNGVVFKVTP